MPEINEAVILAAGSGSRLQTANGTVIKPLVAVGGRPLISYVIDALARVGVRKLHVVTGSNADRLVAALRAFLPREMTLNAIANPDWRKQNGVSALCAAEHVTGPFFLAMADHLFEAEILEMLVAGFDGGVRVAVDRKVSSVFDLKDAMKVGTQGDFVSAIAKNLNDFDAIDTGLFLCSAELFEHLHAAQIEGDCSLADGIRSMAAVGRVRAIDIGDAWWQDVDTAEMLREAEAHVARLATRGAEAKGVRL